MIKVLPCRIDVCLGRFDMLTVEDCTEKELFKYQSKNVIQNLGNAQIMRVIFFSKCLKFDADLKNEEKN